MPLPPRPFEALNDLAIRWTVNAIDIVGWATDGQIALSIAAPPVRTDGSRVVCDLVEIAGTDVLPLYRPEGTRLDKVHVKRVKTQGGSEWHWISEPSEGIIVAAADVLVTRLEVQRFERKHGPIGSEQPGQPARRRAPGPGAPPRYDWDTFFVAIARRIYDSGLPKTQGELVREMLDWFQARQDDQTPDESTVRRKVAMVWRELKRA